MKLFKSLKNQKGNALSLSKGFTLIELLVVIGILAVLLAITLIAINPARQFAQANNTQRASDVNAILNAVNQYMADNKGAVPVTSPAISTCTLAAPCYLSNDPAILPQVDICAVLVSGYLAALPGDPKTGVSTPVAEGKCVIDPVGPPVVPAYNTGYRIYQSALNNRITVSAPGAEQVGTTIPVISVTR